MARRLIAGSIDVPGIGVTGFHVDSSGNLGIGGTNATTGNFTVTSAGAVTTASLTNNGTLATNSLTFGSASSLTAYDTVDLPVRPANPQPSCRQSQVGQLSPVTAGGSAFLSLAAVAGNLLVCCFAWNGTNASAITVTVAPAGFTSWTGMPVTQGVNTRIHAYYKVATGGETSVAATLSGIPDGNVVTMVAEYANMLNAAPAEAVSSTNSGTSATVSTGATGATVQAIDLDVAFLYSLRNGGFTAPASGFTVRNQATTNASFGLLDKVTSATGAQSTSATVGSSANFVAAIQPFKAAATPAPAAGHSQLVGLSHGTSTSLGVVTPTGVTFDLMPAYASLVADVGPIANTETVVSSFTIPAGFCLAGTTFQILAGGAYTFAAGTSTFRIRIGPTTLTGTIPVSRSAVGAANGNVIVLGQVTIRTVGAGGTCEGNFTILSPAAFANQVTGGTPAVVAVDTTVANLLELTYISGAAGASMTYQTATWNLTKW